MVAFGKPTTSGNSHPLHKACSTCSLRESCLPRGLTAGSITAFEQVVETLGPLHRGEHLFRQGDQSQAMYVVRSGFLKSYIETEEGDEYVLGFHMSGELLGADSIGAGHEQCSAEVLDTTLVCRLLLDDVVAMAQRMPELQRQLLRLISRELLVSKSLSRNQAVETRMAAFLLDWGERMAQRGYSRHHFVLPMSRQDIGSYLHLAPESVSRCLHRFTDSAWIELARREVRLTDPNALAALCPDR